MIPSVFWEAFRPFGLARFACAWTNRRRPNGIQRRRNKHCFCNALTLTLQCPDLTYVEGFAGIIPIRHAWTVDAFGNVIDPTWKYGSYNVFVGIPLRTEWVLQQSVRREAYDFNLADVAEAIRSGTAVDQLMRTDSRPPTSPPVL